MTQWRPMTTAAAATLFAALIAVGSTGGHSPFAGPAPAAAPVAAGDDGAAPSFDARVTVADALPSPTAADPTAAADPTPTPVVRSSSPPRGSAGTPQPARRSPAPSPRPTPGPTAPPTAEPTPTPVPVATPRPAPATASPTATPRATDDDGGDTRTFRPSSTPGTTR